ncbi:MAG: phenylalanine--tRNA ligase subunit beta [Candidatus Aenigmatarchaeota archaeon]
MAVVTFDRTDFENLLGRKLKDNDYKDLIPMIGVTTEELNKDSVSFEVFPNRPDMLSSEGFARALKSFLWGDQQKKYESGKVFGSITVDRSLRTIRPYVVCAVVRNIKLTDTSLRSLMQFQEKIHETFGRKRARVSIGVHDISKIEFPLKYAAYGPDEISFVPLDFDEKLTLGEILKKHPKGVGYACILENMKKYPVITDEKNRVLSFPPIINGELTRVTNNSNNLFIDVTGTSKRYIEKTLAILCASFIDRGATIESVKVIYEKPEITPNMSAQKIKLNAGYLNELLDTDLKEGEIKKILSKMGIGFSEGVASVPCYRADVMHQIDIVEDAAIAIGYGNFIPRIPKIPTMAERDALAEKCSAIKEIMIGLGGQEVISFILTNEKRHFEMMNVKTEECATILNPKTEDYTICRKSITPSLLDVLKSNMHNEYPQKIFEVGDCVYVYKSETGAINVRKLAFATSHRDADINEVKSILEAFMKLSGEKYEIRNASNPSMIKGRYGEVFAGEKKIGAIGEIDPSVLKNWELENPVAVFEILVDF